MNLIIKKICLLLILFALPSIGFANKKVIAIIDVQVIDKANEYINSDKIKLFSEIINSQAKITLDSLIQETSANYTINSYHEGCTTPGCMTMYLTQLKADYAIQPIIYYAMGKLRVAIILVDKNGIVSNLKLSAIPTQVEIEKLNEEFKIGTKTLLLKLF